MAFFSIHNVQLSGISACVPKSKALNRNISDISDHDKEKLIFTLGIETRRIADKGTCASDLCFAAAEKLISELNWKRDEIDVLVYVTQTPDYLLPGTSTQLVERLGLSKNCISFDLNQGCAGYVYGMSMVSGLMSSTGLKKGLLLVGDTITKLIAPDDKGLVPLFSDAGTASAFTYDQQAKPIFFNTKTEGKDFDAIIVKEGGAKDNFSKDKASFMKMKGIEVFQFSISKVVPVVEELFELCEVKKENVSAFFFHQANKLILDTLISKLKLNPVKVPSTLKEFGNTNGASIPLTVSNHLSKNNDLVLFCGFGVGLSVAAAILDGSNIVCCDLIEL